MQEAASEYGATVDALVPRTHVHTRSVEYRGYRREDGLWDIEAQLTEASSVVRVNASRGISTAAW
jgi:hypothetical protein